MLFCIPFPRQACADKLKREMEDFGYPPQFPDEQPKEEKKEEREEPIIVDKAKGKKVSTWAFFFFLNLTFYLRRAKRLLKLVV